MAEQAARLVGPLVGTSDDARREFEAYLEESGSLAFRVAFSVLRHRQDAEDVAQDAFVRAHQRFALLRDRKRFRAWLVRVTWRLALDRRRSDARRAARDAAAQGSAGGHTGGEGEMLARERSARLWAAIDCLPQRLRLPLVLASMEGHRVSEVAELLRVPEGTVKSRLFEARQVLRERLHE